jgi:hypothetical protein
VYGWNVIKCYGNLFLFADFYSNDNSISFQANLLGVGNLLINQGNGQNWWAKWPQKKILVAMCPCYQFLIKLIIV